MKARGYFLAAILLTFVLAIAFGMVGSRFAMAQPKMNIHQATPEEPNQMNPEISTEELKNLLSGSKPVVIDARPEMQYALAHIPGAINIGDKEEEYIMKNHPDKGTLIVLYCNGLYWVRTKRVSEKLVKLGYTNVKRYQLGLPVWRALGNTVETNLEGFRYVFMNDKTAVFVDARSQEEFKAGTVPGAVNVRRGLHMDQGTRVIVFGKNAEEARTAAEQIARTAYWNSSYFAGTFEELKRAGLW